MNHKATKPPCSRQRNPGLESRETRLRALSKVVAELSPSPITLFCPQHNAGSHHLRERPAAFGSGSPVALICTSQEHRNRYRVHSPFPALHRLIPTAPWCCEELRAPLQPAVLSPEASDQSPCLESHLEEGAAASCAWLRAVGHAAAPLLHAHKQHLHESTKKTCSRDLLRKAGAQATARTNSVTCFRETCRVCGLTAEGKEPVLDRQQRQYRDARAMLRNVQRNSICHPRAGDRHRHN